MMEGLGNELSRHEGAVRGGGMLWYIGGILVLAGFGWVVKALEAMEPSNLLMALVAFVAGALVLLGPVMRWRQSMVVHEGGLVHRGLLSSMTLRADQVRGVRLIRHRSKYGGHDEIEVQLADGSATCFKGLKGSDQIASFIHAWTRGPAPSDPPQRAAGGWQAPATGATGWQPPGGA